MADQNSLLSKFSTIILPEAVANPTKCDWCHQKIEGKPIKHKNITQSPPVHQFCSRECKNQWAASI